MSPRFAVVVGNPKPRSRTLAAACHVAEELGGPNPDPMVDLAELGPALLDWSDPTVADLVERLSSADLLVVASPTYKATYTGLLKLFLDQIPNDGLGGVVAIPLMLGAGSGHALSAELALRPVLSELGATVPVRGLYVLDSEFDSPNAYAAWLDTARPVVDYLVPVTTELSA